MEKEQIEKLMSELKKQPLDKILVLTLSFVISDINSVKKLLIEKKTIKEQDDVDLEFMAKELAPIDRVNYMKNRIEDEKQLMRKEYSFRINKSEKIHQLPIGFLPPNQAIVDNLDKVIVWFEQERENNIIEKIEKWLNENVIWVSETNSYLIRANSLKLFLENLKKEVEK
jgi:hypothetical protein